MSERNGKGAVLQFSEVQAISPVKDHHLGQANAAEC